MIRRRQRIYTMNNFGTNSTSTMSNAKEVLKVQKKSEERLETDKPEPAAVTKKTHNIRFMDHCFFCVRKTTAKDNKESKYNTELVEEVPSADDSLSLDTSLLCTLNKTWVYLLQGGNWNWATDSNNMIAQFTRLPKMCQFCAEELVTISRLMCELIAEINRLGKVMRDSRYGGVHSWRVDRFEQTLKNSGVDQGSINDTLRFLGKPDVQKAFWLTNSQPRRKDIDDVEGETQRKYNSDVKNRDNGGVEFDDFREDPSYIKVELTCSSENEDANDAVEECQEEFEGSVNDDVDSEAEGSSVVVSNYKTTLDPVASKRMSHCANNNCDDNDDDDGGMESDDFQDDPSYIKEEPTSSSERKSSDDAVEEDQTEYEARLNDDDDDSKAEGSSVVENNFQTTNGRQILPPPHESKTSVSRLACPKPDCGKVFIRKVNLNRHVASAHNHGEKEAFTTTNQSQTIPQRKVMRRRRRYVCPAPGCGKVVSKQSLLSNHVASVHKGENPAFACKDCGKAFWMKGSLRSHVVSVHLKLNSFVCDICGQEFRSKGSLREHKSVHTGERPFCCDICGRCFRQKHVLKDHLKTHPESPEKQTSEFFRCQVPGCGREFLWKRQLRTHVSWVHDEQKSNVCEQCGKAFQTKQSLKEHVQSIHLGVRNHVCDVCGESFASGSALNRHNLIHTGDRPFACQLCGQKFRHKLVLKKHLEGHERKCEQFKPKGPMKQIRKRVVKNKLINSSE